MASFQGLRTSQKLLLGGIIGSCVGVYVLNGAQHDLQRRRHTAAVNLIKSGQAPPGSCMVINGEVMVPAALRNSSPAFAPSPFLEDTWNARFVRENLTTNLQNVRKGRWYTLLSSGFNHADGFHLGFNMLALASIAPSFIRMTGTTAFLSVWLISGINGSFAGLENSLLKTRKAVQEAPEDDAKARYHATTSYVGASTSVLGLFAATAVLIPQAKFQLMFIPYDIPARTLVGATLVGSVLADMTGLMPGYGHWGHVGGILGGIAVGSALKHEKRGGRMAVILALTAMGPLILARQLETVFPE